MRLPMDGVINNDHVNALCGGGGGGGEEPVVVARGHVRVRVRVRVALCGERGSGGSSRLPKLFCQ